MLDTSKIRTGQVSIEFLITSMIYFLSFALNLELTAKARTGLVLHHLSFLYLRYRALGDSKGDTRGKLNALVKNTFGSTEGKRWEHAIKKAEEQRKGHGRGYVEAAITYRYLPLIKVPFKRSFQSVRRCKFPY